MILRYFLSLWLIWGGFVWSQCQTNIDFNTWTQEGHAANGNWNVQAGGNVVFQTINGDPTFYVSPDTFINVAIQGTISINDFGNKIDDDFVGFVFGYQEPEINPNQYDFWLFDWKAKDQVYSNSTHLAQEGFALTQVQGNIPQGAYNYLPAFWARINSPNSTSLATQYGPTQGWINGSTYDFTLIYTSTRITIFIDSTVIFDLPGCYEAGRFGFYNYSQPNVRYSNFSYRLISNFELKDNVLDQCINEAVKFSFTDSTCAGNASASDNIAAWNWDFGDGSTGSSLTNPNHTYTQTGPYDVTLRITDINGCQDSITKTIVVHPSPVPTLGVPDSIWCAQDSVQLFAGGGDSYNWKPAASLDQPKAFNPKAFAINPQDYTVSVISPFGCRADTSVYVHFFQAGTGPDTSICMGDTTSLSVQAGMQFAWTPASSLSLAATSTPNAFPVISTNYSVIVTDSAGCMDTTTQFITVNPLPLVSLNPDTAVCPGEPVMFSAQGALSYQWQDASGSVLGISDSLLLMPNTSFDLIVVGTDTNSCRAYDTTQLAVYPLPTVEAGLDQNLCSNQNLTLGAVTNPSGTYLWTPNLGLTDPTIGQPVFLPPTPDTFSFILTLTDLNGCINQDSVTIRVSPFDLTASAIDVPCFGEPVGSLTVQAIGSSPFQYSWIDGGGNVFSQQFLSTNSATEDSLFSGSYSVVVVDSLGCTDTLGQIVNQPSAPLSMTLANLQNVDCFGNSTGEISVTASGGTPMYTFSLDGGFSFQNSASFMGLGAAAYTILAVDSMGCEAMLTDTIRTPTGLFAQLNPIKHIDCFGNGNGALTVIGSGGQAPYQASLDGTNFVTNLQFDNLTPGLDTLSMVDVNGCLTNVPFQIFEPSPVSLSLIAQRNVPCFGDTTGVMVLTASGGSGAFQYQLGNTPFQPDSVFAMLSAGSYTVQVRDDSLCPAQLPVLIEEPPLLSLNLLQQRDIACYGQQNGAVTVQPVGGTPGYVIAIDTLAFGTDSTFAGLAAGNYLINVQDDSGCTFQAPVEITQPDSLITEIDQLVHVACFGDNSGQVMLTTVGGTSPFLFTMNGGALSPDSSFSSLLAGIYNFVVLDDRSCTDTVSVHVNQADSLSLSLLDQIDIDCFSNSNGQVAVSGAGGVAPYSFRLNSQVWGADTMFANLPPGPHLIQMQDDSSCIKELMVDIVEPELLRSEIGGLDIRCFGENSGQVQTSLTGGTVPYILEWSTGDTGLVVGNLFPGLYRVEVLDSNGCNLEDSIRITEPDALTIELIPASIVEAYCDWPNGAASVNTSGGITPYLVQWVGRNLVEGPDPDQLYGDTTYQVSVTDFNGCVSTIEVILPHSPKPSVAFETLPTSDREILLSEAQVQFLNLTSDAISYDWNFGDGGLSVETSPLHTFIDPGTYQVTLTAENGYFACPRDTTITLRIIPDGNLFIPTAFSPNDDGTNDFFHLGVEGAVFCHWEIYDRWGKLVARFEQPDASWDGRILGGGPAPEGTYVIKIDVEFNNGNRLSRGGSLTLMR